MHYILFKKILADLNIPSNNIHTFATASLRNIKNKQKILSFLIIM